MTILEETVEQYTFCTYNNGDLNYCKNELISQIRRFPLRITAKSFTQIDRYYLGDVSDDSNWIRRKYLIFSRSFWLQVGVGCCTCIIIFIQFFLAEK